MKEYARSFYLSEAWRNTRDAYFKARYGLCERCGAAGDIVHHKKYITPENIHDPRITLDWSNLELLCQDCHNKEHSVKRNEIKRNERYSVDEKGNILPPPSQKNNPFGNR